jgi:hypothetical protein
MPTGGFLRTNFRRTGQQQITAIGGGIPQTSWVALGSLAQSGQGLNLPFGGFIMGSFTNSGEITGGITYGYSVSNANISAQVIISAYGAMSAFYGSGLYGSGYAIMPFKMNRRGPVTSVANNLTLVWTFSAFASTAGCTYSVDKASCFYVFPLGSQTLIAPTASVTIAAVWAGWVISSP